MADKTFRLWSMDGKEICLIKAPDLESAQRSVLEEMYSRKVVLEEEEEVLLFTCPKCGNHDAECRECNAVVVSNIICLRKNGDFDYDTPIIEDSEIESLGCVHCGFVPLADNGEPINDVVDFARWVKKNCPQNNS